jgi:hypothetical protein
MNENRLICRGKREDTGKYVEGYYVRLDGIDKPLHIIIDRAGQYNRVLPETVGECTGCLDSMGRLIFEGDIVNDINGETYEVEYDAVDGAYFIGQRTTGISYAYLHEIDKPEIIGNVNEVSEDE